MNRTAAVVAAARSAVYRQGRFNLTEEQDRLADAVDALDADNRQPWTFTIEPAHMRPRRKKMPNGHWLLWRERVHTRYLIHSGRGVFVLESATMELAAEIVEAANAAGLR